MENIHYKPKKMKVHKQDVNFLPTYIQFHKWNESNKDFEPCGTMFWNGTEWTAFGKKDANFHTMEHLLTTTRTFGEDVYSKDDRNFYKPFYYIPSTGTKVDVYYSKPVETKENKSIPKIQDEVLKEIS